MLKDGDGVGVYVRAEGICMGRTMDGVLAEGFGVLEFFATLAKEVRE